MEMVIKSNRKYVRIFGGGYFHLRRWTLFLSRSSLSVSLTGGTMEEEDAGTDVLILFLLAMVPLYVFLLVAPLSSFSRWRQGGSTSHESWLGG
jgi:hypothetical protein